MMQDYPTYVWQPDCFATVFVATCCHRAVWWKIVLPVPKLGCRVVKQQIQLGWDNTTTILCGAGPSHNLSRQKGSNLSSGKSIALKPSPSLLLRFVSADATSCKPCAELKCACEDIEVSKSDDVPQLQRTLHLCWRMLKGEYDACVSRC